MPAPMHAAAAPAVAIPARSGPELARWSLPSRILFRFVAAYWILFTLPYQGHSSLIGTIPGTGWLRQQYIQGSRAVVEWVAAHVFHLTGPIATFPRVNGSGDTTLDYIQESCLFVLAAAATLIWSILDRKRPGYRRFHAWLRIWIRYTLALTLYSYGFAKVFPLQFTPPALIRLLEPYHQFSPMGVLWSFMGASAGYTIFAGASEVLGGTLLLFRGTTAIGALVSFGVLLNVVMLNFCYDVPVKLYSTNLLLMAVFLAAPELRRLMDVFVLNRAAPPSRVDSILFRSRRARIAAVSLQSILIAGYLVFFIWGGVRSYRRYYDAPKSPLYGIWEVQNPGPPLRWRYVIMDRPQSVAVRLLDDSQEAFPAKFDEKLARIDLGKAGALNYTRAGDARLRLEGTVSNTPVSLDLGKVDMSKYLLVSRGFHWINERPFNR